MDPQLLGDVKNYINVTWDDLSTDNKITGIIMRGMAFLDGVAGCAQNYLAEDFPRSLLFDYVRYCWADSIEHFKVNFLSELNMLRSSERINEKAL